MTEQHKIKSLFLLPSLNRGGAETQAVDLVNGLDGREFEKYLFTFHSALDQLQRVDQASIDFQNCPRKYKFDITPVKKIAKLIDREQIDVIHCTSQFSLLLGWLARCWSGCKPQLVTAVHTTLNRSLKEEMKDRLIYRYLLRRCSNIIFVCNSQKQHWVTKYPELIDVSSVVYNGVDVQRFNPDVFADAGSTLARELNIPADVPVITCVAGFRPEKGHAILIEAFAQLDSRPILVLAGDGEKRSEIESLVKKKGLQDRVRFLGVIDDVRRVLALSDVTVLASTAVETFSIAMLESMAMEVPVVATDMGGMAEAVIDDHTGYIVPPGDIVKLRDALSKVLENSQTAKKLGRNARVMVEKQFTRETMLEQTKEILLQAGKRGG